MKETTKAYLAGLFDGEGSISITHTEHTQYIMITLSNNCKSLLLGIKDAFGGGLAQSTQHKQCWQWAANNQLVATKFLETVLPYLVLRKAEAEIAVQLTRTACRQGQNYTDQQRLVRHIMFDKLKEATEYRKETLPELAAIGNFKEEE